MISGQNAPFTPNETIFGARLFSSFIKDLFLSTGEAVGLWLLRPGVQGSAEKKVSGWNPVLDGP